MLTLGCPTRFFTIRPILVTETPAMLRGYCCVWTSREKQFVVFASMQSLFERSAGVNR